MTARGPRRRRGSRGERSGAVRAAGTGCGPVLTAMTLTNVVLPEYCSPTRVSSISSFQKSARNQSSSLLKRASMLPRRAPPGRTVRSRAEASRAPAEPGRSGWNRAGPRRAAAPVLSAASCRTAPRRVGPAPLAAAHSAPCRPGGREARPGPGHGDAAPRHRAQRLPRVLERPLPGGAQRGTRSPDRARSRRGRPAARPQLRRSAWVLPTQNALRLCNRGSQQLCSCRKVRPTARLPRHPRGSSSHGPLGGAI